MTNQNPEQANALADRPALAIESLSWAYGKTHALSNINLSVARGEVLILLGPNGAGKTTLFSLISGLFSPRSGTIRIAGRSTAREGASALAPLGIVFQSQTLDLDLTVAQNLQYFCALRGVAGDQIEQRIIEELRQFNMLNRLNDKVRSLNGGHRRRVDIARAFLHHPSILLLDEPTVGLDIPTRAALLSTLHARASQDGTALLWATHLIDEPRASDRIVVLNDGRICADGRPADLQKNTSTSNLASAFDSICNAPALP